MDNYPKIIPVISSTAVPLKVSFSTHCLLTYHKNAKSESLLCFHGNRATHGNDETFKEYGYTAMSLQRDTTPMISCLLAWVAELFQKEVYS